jgi:hypothetical protein
MLYSELTKRGELSGCLASDQGDKQQHCCTVSKNRHGSQESMAACSVITENDQTLFTWRVSCF